jgi:hypothetical protein
VEITLVHLGMYLEERSPGVAGKLLRSRGTKPAEGRSSKEEESRRRRPGDAEERAGSGGIRAGALPPVPAAFYTSHLDRIIRPSLGRIIRGG